ncbi:hypothetical protein NDU88_007279 [Pleurodeles waltl]|uniref:Uncharacterized protein n=1 Tax=Pleurodeles waltl TaxID=8319 RepID=A0AAV7PKU1_PLEWA|nr:hypothetical protein NDU88_007279 [Pleurodeles waltl]
MCKDDGSFFAGGFTINYSVFVGGPFGNGGCVNSLADKVLSDGIVVDGIIGVVVNNVTVTVDVDFTIVVVLVTGTFNGNNVVFNIFTASIDFIVDGSEEDFSKRKTNFEEGEVGSDVAASEENCSYFSL